MTDSPLRQAIRDRLTRARLAGDRPLAAALRTALAALENAEAVPAADTGRGAASEHVAGALRAGEAEAARRVLAGADEVRLLEDEEASLREAAAQYDDGGRPDAAVDARRAADALAELRRVHG